MLSNYKRNLGNCSQFMEGNLFCYKPFVCHYGKLNITIKYNNAHKNGTIFLSCSNKNEIAINRLIVIFGAETT